MGYIYSPWGHRELDMTERLHFHQGSPESEDVYTTEDSIWIVFLG